MRRWLIPVLMATIALAGCEKKSDGTSGTNSGSGSSTSGYTTLNMGDETSDYVENE